MLRGRTGVGPFEPSLNAAPSLPQTEKFQIVALQQSDVDHCDRSEMDRGDRLPEPIRVARHPDVIVWMQPPVQRSDDLKIPDEADEAVNQTPVMIDEKRAGPLGQALLERLRRRYRMEHREE